MREQLLCCTRLAALQAHTSQVHALAPNSRMTDAQIFQIMDLCQVSANALLDILLVPLACALCFLCMSFETSVVNTSRSKIHRRSALVSSDVLVK